MLNRLRSELSDYPRQFWLMFFGMIVATTGSSMIWPFDDLRQRNFGASLVTVASLMTISAVTGDLFCGGWSGGRRVDVNG